MRDTSRKLLGGLTILLLAGLLIGWAYGRPLLGLLVATAIALGWQIKQLLSLARALRGGNLDDVRYGENMWSQIVSDIDFLKQRGDRYKKQHRTLLKEVQKSINALPDGAIMLNQNFEILRTNSAAQKMLGIKRKKDRGQRADNLLRDPNFADYLQSGKYGKGVEIMSPLHHDHWLNCRLVPYGQGLHLLLVRDITERKRIDKTRREFVANASHELRSPLTVITGYLHTLVEDGDMPVHWRKPVDDMHTQAERMNKIVAELLELSQLESKGPDSTKRRIDVCGLLSIARKAYAGQIGVPDIVIDCQSNAALLGNSNDIESVISNLLTNAIRYTPEDGRITMSWECDEMGGRLTVQDTGEGIDQADIPRLTERFFRVDRGRARADGGIGLGLAIVKHALGRHEGRLEVDSKLGEGSKFTCYFPIERLARAELHTLSQAGNSA